MHSNDDVASARLTLAGREVADPWDRLARYCGLEWSGGPPETWAYHYYDTLGSDPDHVEPVDVLAASALHPGLNRDDLAWFRDRHHDLEVWLAAIPLAVDLSAAETDLLEHLASLADWPDAPNLTLLTKVLHRKRPHLIPLIDRHVVDWYRPVTGERNATRAWPLLLGALAADLTTNAELLASLADGLESRLGHRLSHLRIVDIAIWMGGQR